MTEVEERSQQSQGAKHDHQRCTEHEERLGRRISGCEHPKPRGHFYPEQRNQQTLSGAAQRGQKDH
jgi:hypothetical protein